MKKLLLALFACATALAVNFAWDDNVNPPDTTYRLYELVGTNRVLKASVGTNLVASVAFPVGTHTAVVRAVGTGGVESVDSNQAVFVVPGPVTNFRIDLSLTGTLTLTPQ